MKLEDLNIGQTIEASTDGHMEHHPVVTGQIRHLDFDRRSARIVSTEPPGEFDVHENLILRVVPRLETAVELHKQFNAFLASKNIILTEAQKAFAMVLIAQLENSQQRAFFTGIATGKQFLFDLFLEFFRERALNPIGLAASTTPNHPKP